MKSKMSRQEIARRYVLFIISLFFSAIGVAFTKHGELGVSPISSVANVLSDRFTALSLGSWLIIWNVVLLLGQIVLLRRRFQLIQLLQIPLSFLFGWFTDFGMWLVKFFPAESYPVRLLMVLIGIAILGFGISLSVIADVILNSGEAFVKALSDTMHLQFGNVKIAFDIFGVVIAVVLSLIFFDMHIVGTREGTIISAVFTGMTVKLYTKWLKTPVERLLTGKPERT